MVETLRSGGILLYPTETVWGLGCDASNPEAIRRIFQIKRRAESKALISLVDSDETLSRYVSLPDTLPDIRRQNGLRPLTLVLGPVLGLPAELLAADGTAAFRLASTPLCLHLCRELGGPLVSTSANFSGHAAPARFDEIDAGLIALVDYVAGPQFDETVSDGRPSRIVKIEPDGSLSVIRP